MGSDIVYTYSDALFSLYRRLDVATKQGSQNGWPYCETETGLRVFQEAAEPHIRGATQSAAPCSTPTAPPRLQRRPSWLQTYWPACAGALAVICCGLALVWPRRAHVPASAPLQPQDTEEAKPWAKAGPQLLQALLVEMRLLSSNQDALASSQVQIGTGLGRLCDLDAQLAASASTQANASLGLAAAQTALVRETTNLLPSLRETFEQRLGEAAGQQRADTTKLQSQFADAVASLRETFRQGLSETAGQHSADATKLQAQVAGVAASQRALLDRLSGPTNVPSLAFPLPGIRTRTTGDSILLIFDDGLFLHGACFRPDAKRRLEAVAQTLAQVSPPVRIEVIGCADDDRVFGRWTGKFEESLALERAAAVVDYFIELGLFTPKRLAALSSRATERPFPSDTIQNRSKNRTVVLRISTEDKLKEAYDRPAR